VQRESTIYPNSNQQRLLSMLCITNFMGHDLTIIVLQFLFFHKCIWNRHECHSFNCIVINVMCII